MEGKKLRHLLLSEIGDEAILQSWTFTGIHGLRHNDKNKQRTMRGQEESHNYLVKVVENCKRNWCVLNRKLSLIVANAREGRNGTEMALICGPLLDARRPAGQGNYGAG